MTGRGRTFLQRAASERAEIGATTDACAPARGTAFARPRLGRALAEAALGAAAPGTGFLLAPAVDEDTARPARARALRPRASDAFTPSREESWPWRCLSTAADGFMAPEAPPNGPLAANGTGWLLGVGGHALRLYPNATAVAASTAPLATTLVPVLGSGLVGQPGVGAALLACAAPLALGLGLVRVAAKAAIARQRAQAMATPHFTELPPGTLVRLVGSVPAQATVPSLFRGRPAVLSRNRVGLAEETRGVDFWLESASGERVRVCVRSALLLDKPTRLRDLPVCDPVSCDWFNLSVPRLRPHLPTARPLRHRLLPPRLYEATIGPGDHIEVCGVIHREAGPEGQAGPGRGTPLLWSLRGGPGRPLLVRRLRV